MQDLYKYNLVELGPVDWCLPFLDEELVTLGEVFAAKKTSVSREGRRVNGLEQVVLLTVDHGSLLLGVRAPQKEDDSFCVVTKKVIMITD